MQRRIRNGCSGFSLIELMVATAIFSVGLGSISMLMLTAIRGTADAGHHTVAAAQANSLAELIIMHSDAAGHYINPAGSDPAACHEILCSDEAMAGGNWGFWQAQLREELPGGRGLVCRDSTPDDGDVDDPSCDGAGELVIKIFWQEPLRGQDDSGGFRRLVSRISW